MNCQNNQGKTPTMRALDGKLGYDLAEFLIKKNADVNLLDKNGNSVLLYICQMGQSKLAHLLIEKGADINCTNQNGETCFALACKNYRFESVIDAMIQRGVNLKHALTSNNGASLIIDYIKRTNNTGLLNLLTQNINVNHKNKEGSTVLHIACELAFHELVKRLIQIGADVNAMDIQHETPLHKCCSGKYFYNSQISNRVEIAKFLIKNGADLSHRNKMGQSYLSFMCIQNTGSDEMNDFNELKKIFRNHTLNDLQKAFECKDISVFRQKVLESINNEDINSFVISWDHVRALKLLELDKKNPSQNDFTDSKILEYFSSFQFKEKLFEDVINNLKSEKEMLEIAKTKINQSFTELNEIQIDQIMIDFDNLFDYLELKRLISDQDLINLILIEESLIDKSRKKTQILNKIDHFLLNIEERILLANHLSNLIAINLSA
jgi:ankyrin repeat protein